MTSLCPSHRTLVRVQSVLPEEYPPVTNSHSICGSLAAAVWAYPLRNTRGQLFFYVHTHKIHIHAMSTRMYIPLDIIFTIYTNVSAYVNYICAHEYTQTYNGLYMYTCIHTHMYRTQASLGLHLYWFLCYKNAVPTRHWRPWGNSGLLSSCKIPKSGPIVFLPRKESIQRFLFKLANTYLLSLGHIFYFSIYMVIFLNLASYRNVQTCMKIAKPSARPWASITKDPALPRLHSSFLPSASSKARECQRQKLRHSVLLANLELISVRSSTSQGTKADISQAKFCVLSANADCSVHLHAILKIKS